MDERGDRLQELVFGLESEVEGERKLCLTWLSQIGTEEVLPHLEKLCNDPSLEVRGLARQLAGELRERLELAKERPWGVDPVELLAHADPRARLAGAMIAYEKQGDALRDALAERLAVEQDAFVRASLVKALRHYPEPKVLELLADCLLDPDARVRSNTVEALMAYEHPVLQKRVTHLLHDPDMRVQGTVLIYLAKRVPERIQPLLEKMSASEESWARRTARHVYRSLGWPVPAEPEPAAGRDEARELLRANDPQVRIQGVWKALQMPVDDRLAALRRALEDEVDPQVVAALARALGHPGHTEDLPLLARHLASEDPRVRAATIEGIARIGGADALHLIEPMAADASPRVRSAALAALERLRKRRVLGAVRALLDADDADALSAGLLELARVAPAEAGHVLDMTAPAWDAARRRRIAALLATVKLHGPAQAMVERVAARCSGGEVSGPPSRAGGHAADAVRGARVLRLWEAGRLTDPAFAAEIALVEAAESEIAEGRRVKESILARHEALVRLGQAAQGAVSEVPSRPGVPLAPPPPAVEDMSYMPGGFKRLGPADAPVPAVAGGVALACALAAAIAVLAWPTKAPRPPRPVASPIVLQLGSGVH